MSDDRPEVRDMTIADFRGPTKELPCRRCTKPMVVSAQTVNPPRHFECGIQDAIDAMHQMRAKRGPIYDRYVMGMLVHAQSLARDNGIKPLN